MSKHMMEYVEEQADKTKEEGELLEAYQTAVGDVRYILNQYSTEYPAEAFETIRKIVYDRKLKGVKSGL